MNFQMLTDKEKSEFLRKNFPANKISRAMRKAICGVGINDADYLISTGVGNELFFCPANEAWRSMIKRTHCQKRLAKTPAYFGVSVCKEWCSFMEFRSWWMENQVDGWCLDKDLLTDLRIYSPAACLYIPEWLNLFTVDRAAARGDFPIGVVWHTPWGKYQAQCSNPFGSREHLGYFATAIEAHLAWKSRKLEIAFGLKDRMDEIDSRIYPRVVEIINRAK